MSIFELWLLTVVGRLSVFLCVASLALVIIVGAAWAIWADAYREDKVAWSKRVSRLTVALCLTSLGAVLTPSTSDVYVIMGGYFATNSAEAQKLPENVLKAANRFLEGVASEKETSKK